MTSIPVAMLLWAHILLGRILYTNSATAYAFMLRLAPPLSNTEGTAIAFKNDIPLMFQDYLINLQIDVYCWLKMR